MVEGVRVEYDGPITLNPGLLLQTLKHTSCCLQMVASEYDELYPGEVAAVHLVYKTGSLDPHVKEYNSCLRSLEDLIDDYASQKARDKDVKRQTVILISVCNFVR